MSLQNNFNSNINSSKPRSSSVRGELLDDGKSFINPQYYNEMDNDDNFNSTPGEHLQQTFTDSDDEPAGTFHDSCKASNGQTNIFNEYSVVAEIHKRQNSSNVLDSYDNLSSQRRVRMRRMSESLGSPTPDHTEKRHSVTELIGHYENLVSRDKC